MLYPHCQMQDCASADFCVALVGDVPQATNLTMSEHQQPKLNGPLSATQYSWGPRFFGCMHPHCLAIAPTVPRSQGWDSGPAKLPALCSPAFQPPAEECHQKGRGRSAMTAFLLHDRDPRIRPWEFSYRPSLAR
jgi:hypothetical protein